MTLEALIKERIRAHGPISVAEYMALALSHPEYGYYMRGDPFGVHGDFITSPEISQMFGELIGAWLANQWILMGKPQAALAECGPGRGTLMNDILRATKQVGGFHDAVSVHLVEISPSLRRLQWNTLAGKHPVIEWHTELGEIPPGPLLLVANEFFDALPIRQFVGEQERLIGLQDDRLCFTIPSGAIRESCEAGEQIATAIASRIAQSGGAALVIDYGYSRGARGETLQSVKKHQHHDVLAGPGTADLTAHVDFDAMKAAATKAGAAAYGPVPQGFFLASLGIAARLGQLCSYATKPQKSAMLSAAERLTSPDQMGDLFKVMCILRPTHPHPEGF